MTSGQKSKDLKMSSVQESKSVKITIHDADASKGSDAEKLKLEVESLH